MGNDLLTGLSNMILDGVSRNAIKTASEWALKYRIMGKPFDGPWSFKYHPWSKAIHDCPKEHIVGQKAAQMGYTEAAMNRTFKYIDIDRESVLYVLPTERPDAVDFSASRFDPALEASPHLKNLFSDTKNLGLKRAGTSCLYIRSARSRSQLKSIPAGNLVFDEMDEMDPAAITLARERSSGQLHKTEFDLSTPTIPRFGINGEFDKSDQNHYVFRCPHCNRWTEFTFPECIVITADFYHEESIRDSYFICKECKVTIDHRRKPEYFKNGGAHWEPMFSGRHVGGFHINQMYSFTIEPHQFAISALRRHISEEDEQEFFNSKLGLPHITKGAKITDEDIEQCKGGYESSNSASYNHYNCMGVDVGNKIHVEITEYLLDGQLESKTDDPNLKMRARVKRQLTVDEFEELDELMIRYAIHTCVIDRHPEQRKAKEFANRFPGQIFTCVTTGNKIAGRDVIRSDNPEEPMVSIDRTSWMDVALRRFRARTISLPFDVNLEYQDHIKAPVRVYKKDAQGKPRGTYVAADPDHYALARTYCEIAARIGFEGGNNENIKSVL